VVGAPYSSAALCEILVQCRWRRAALASLASHPILAPDRGRSNPLPPGGPYQLHIPIFPHGIVTYSNTSTHTIRPLPCLGLVLLVHACILCPRSASLRFSDGIFTTVGSVGGRRHWYKPRKTPFSARPSLPSCPIHLEHNEIRASTLTFSSRQSYHLLATRDGRPVSVALVEYVRLKPAFWIDRF
jgi:hypothetical protein